MKEAAQLLRRALTDLIETSKWLERSFLKCKEISLKENYSPDEFDAFENLTSRYARTCDLLINKVYRAIDRVELESSGTMIDILNKAHKRGLVDSINEIREIKELRNVIAHDYANDQLKQIFSTVFNHIPILFNLVQKAENYCSKYFQ